MRRWLGTLVLLFAAALAHAQSPAKLLPAQSEIVFVSKQLGVPVEGKFGRFDAQVAFDPRQPESGRVTLSIDVASAALGVPEVDGELPKPVWFDAVKNPRATFQSSAIKALGGGKFEIAGRLAIKGSARDVVVPVTLAQSGALTTASGAFAIRRLDYQIGEGEWADTSMVANDVQVKFRLALTGIAPL